MSGSTCPPSWKPGPPPPGHFKLNFDGSAIGWLGPTDFSGIIHSGDGNLLLSFAGPPGISDSTSAEFAGLFDGLSIFQDRFFGSLIIEGDSKVAIDWFATSKAPPQRH
ncbi:uncharacterized protein [Aristolochia californica]|uniref:uncharacterized protein n=1 Tax=Aristolochia californica TaxID=171875 RepID=UPI0035DDD07C